MSLMDGLLCFFPIPVIGEQGIGPLNGLSKLGAGEPSLTTEYDFPGGHATAKFTSTSQALRVWPDHELFNTSPVTASGWLHRSANTFTYANILSPNPYTDGSPGTWALRGQFNGNSMQAVFRETGTNTFRQVNSAITLNAWYHVALTYDGTGVMILFVNGARVGIYNGTVPCGVINDQRLLIGNVSTTCSMAHVGCWNRVLDDGELFRLWNNGQPSMSIFDQPLIGAGGVPVPFARFDGNPFAGVS